MTIEEARAIVACGDDAVVTLLIELANRVKELEQRLAKNSGNSSKPTSSDGPNKATLKPMPKSLRKPSGKKPGGQ